MELKRRVLIIDDDRDFAASLNNILELESYEVHVSHGAKGIGKIIKDFQADVALVDIRLGRSNGVDVIAKLQALRPCIMSVMITAYASVETAIAALRQGAYDYLRKPFHKEELLATLNRCFDRIELDQKKTAAEKERARLETQLHESQRMETIGRLAGGIAHDFNNLLTPILGYVDLGLGCKTGDNKTHDVLKNIKKTAVQAKDLVQQILDLSHQHDQQRKPFYLGPIITDVVRLIHASYPLTIKVLQNLDPDCKAIMGIPAQVRQVIMNLCVNACQAMKIYGGVLEINLEMVDVDENLAKSYPDLTARSYVKLTVSDTGQGIDQPMLEKIFDPFFTTKGGEEGTGLGLAIVRRIVRNHEGAIKVESEPGVGSHFTIFFPPSSCNPSSVQDTSDKETTFGGDERILLVDDEEAITIMGKEMLEHLGYSVEVSNSSVSALDQFKRVPNGFELVITDLAMPVMTGWELAQGLLNIRSDIPIIITTSYVEGISKETCKSLGIRECIDKPFDIRKLGKAIRRVLDYEGGA